MSPMRRSARSPIMWICYAFLVIAGFFLITEHTAHTFGILPLLLFLACPFLHMFSHGSHRGHGEPKPGHDHTGMPKGKEGTP